MEAGNPWSEDAAQYPRRGRRQKELELILRLGKITRGGLILDVGCGVAYQCALLRDKGYNVVCVNLNNNATFTHLDALSDGCFLPFKDNCFDVVYSSHVLEHIQDKNKALQEMIRVLKPNGNVHIIVPTCIWKIGQLLSYYPELVITCVKRASNLLSGFSKRVSKNEKEDTDKRMPTLKDGSKIKRLYLKAKRYCFPEVHGTAMSNLEELRVFRVSSWLELFKSNGLTINKIVFGPLYMPPPFPVPFINATRFRMYSSVIFDLSYQRTKDKEVNKQT